MQRFYVHLLKLLLAGFLLETPCLTLQGDGGAGYFFINNPVKFDYFLENFIFCCSWTQSFSSSFKFGSNISD